MAVAVAALGMAAAGAAAQSADPDAAERQYRIARRLAAEGSPEAASALTRVVELDPDGPRADDALVEHARLLDVAEWPEDLGRISAARAKQARALLGRVLDGPADADRLSEARYYAALLRLEPLPDFDESRARFELITLATADHAEGWRHRARYTVAWLDEQQGRIERAAEAYTRVRIDAAETEAAVRAGVGLARIGLRSGDHGRAAALLQQAVDDQAPPVTAAASLRELAVRSLLARRGVARFTEPLRVVAPIPEVRSAIGPEPLPDGGVVVGDRKSGVILAVGPDGRPGGRWTLADLQALAVSPIGGIFAAAGTSIHRLELDRAAVPVASLGDYAPLGALAVDGAGRFWLIDRRGDRLGRLDPDAGAPVEVGPGKGSKLADISWDGRRLIVLHGKDRSLLAIDAQGTTRPVGGQGVQKPVAVTTDPTGTIAVLDGRSATVLFLDDAGRPLTSVACADAGLERPTSIGFGLDGALHLFDEASGAWAVLP
jgi:hypothetical protein